MEYHEYANLFPMMTQAEYSELVNDMRENGYDKTAPIILYQNRILDGRNRWEAAQDAGVIPLFVEFDGDDALGFVIRHNLKRRHLNESQRAIVAGRLANLQHGQRVDRVANLQLSPVTQSAAAEMLNVSPRMVAAAKAIEREAPELVEFIEGGLLTMNSAQKMAAYSSEEREPMIEQIKHGEKPHVSHNSGENEWYTPLEFIEAARAVMGRIDIDPASSEIANQTVGADVYYDKNANGLEKVWAGNIWMNPPYSSDLIGKFCDKLKTEYMNNRIQSAIVLVNNATETNWFFTLTTIASAIVFTKGRVKFLDPSGNPGAPLQGQAIIYIGELPEKFLEEFYKFGWGAKL